MKQIKKVGIYWVQTEIRNGYSEAISTNGIYKNHDIWHVAVMKTSNRKDVLCRHIA